MSGILEPGSQFWGWWMIEVWTEWVDVAVWILTKIAVVDYSANSQNGWFYSCGVIFYTGLYFVTEITSVKTKALKRV